MRKSQVSGRNISEQYLLLLSRHKRVYLGLQNKFMEFHLCLWGSIFVYGVLSLSMQFYLCLGSSIFVYGVLSLSMARLGAKYEEVGCKVYGYFWVHVYTFWVHVYGSVGCMYAVVGCMPDCR